MIRDVTEYYEQGKEIAKIDRTFADDTKIILIDEKTPYIQRFWVDGTDKELVERCIQMRKLKIESL